ncbi:MAG: ABC transporter permease subunit [Clostridiales bacterium]|nr:ABC transporter permease subunit [Clostridiales bacterium]
MRQFLLRVRQHKLHLIMILPVLAQFIIFKYLPLYGVTLAFKDYRILEGISSSPWVGLFNFQRLFSSPDFFRVFKNTIILASLNFVFGFPAPIILALMINELRGKVFKRVTQTISYLPHFVSWVILAGIFMEVLSPSRGPINAALKALGMNPIFFLGNPDWFRPTLVVTNIWKGLGWGSIVYLAALGGINEELYDAARVDGCGRFQRIYHVTLPGILPVVIIMLILASGNLVSDNFDQVFNLQNDGVINNVGDVLGTFIYRSGLKSLDYSFSTTLELFRNLISLALVMSTNKISKLVGEYGLW